jgi:predicted RNA polymerase sigma factor
VPLADQDRSRWDRALVTEGTSLAAAALQQEPIGEYAVQAAVAALHDAALRYEDTDWERILSLYSVLERMTDSPVVRLNRAVAVAMVEGADAGMALLDELSASSQLERSHRVSAVRGHLLERKGDVEAARAEYIAAAGAAANQRERDYLTIKAATLNSPEHKADGTQVHPPPRGR